MYFDRKYIIIGADDSLEKGKIQERRRTE